MRGRAIPVLLSLAVAGTLLATACSASARYKTLSFFFEGVPRPGEEELESVPFDAVVQTAEERLKLLRATQYREIVRHEPFAKRECARCHDMFQGGELREAQGGLCRSCHDGLGSEHEFVHGPVAVNACLECHHPHQSERRSLLLLEVEATCTRCHHVQDFIPGDHHDSVGTTSEGCTECHDPHGGSDRFFLKTVARASGE